LSGSDAVLIVTEPTMSGLHDLERVSELANYFNLKQFVCVNKADISTELTEGIESRCEELGVIPVGTILYDTAVTRAQMAGKAITEYVAGGQTSAAIRKMWKRIDQGLNVS
jgi:MinD superfamily P-loop ATPase